MGEDTVVLVHPGEQIQMKTEAEAAAGVVSSCSGHTIGGCASFTESSSIVEIQMQCQGVYFKMIAKYIHLVYISGWRS